MQKHIIFCSDSSSEGCGGGDLSSWTEVSASPPHKQTYEDGEEEDGDDASTETESAERGGGASSGEATDSDVITSTNKTTTGQQLFLMAKEISAIQNTLLEVCLLFPWARIAHSVKRRSTSSVIHSIFRYPRVDPAASHTTHLPCIIYIT